jgi:hypothetical protein
MVAHHPRHVLYKDANDFESLCCSGSSLVLGESVQRLQGRLDVLLSENFLHRADYVVLSKITRQRERAHFIVLALRI